MAKAKAKAKVPARVPAKQLTKEEARAVLATSEALRHGRKEPGAHVLASQEYARAKAAAADEEE